MIRCVEEEIAVLVFEPPRLLDGAAIVIGWMDAWDIGCVVTYEYCRKVHMGFIYVRQVHFLVSCTQTMK